MGDTIKITDDSVKDFVAKLQVFIDEPTNSAALKQLRAWVPAGQTGPSTTEYNPGAAYTSILPGNTSAFPAANTVAGAFFTYLSQVKGAIDGLQTTVGNLQSDLQNASLALNNGNDDAITQAQMLQLLNDVLNGGGTTTPPK
ncbi:hypothetical protein [Kitasatospora kifunensis]|uniref:Uncharacterized protein n=1 Tax=Kitasatospora kifunensis TaxID=58351 RepID=A0A7W7R5Y8_KITKI|nr:hypothetical protein [Kitasatospora kifunensis]MBB4926035.1 hypothetical protein [Kitasatospora kifunensis]